MEINNIIKLIEAVSEHGLTSFVLEENGSKVSMKKEKEIVTVTAPASVQTVITPGAAIAHDGMVHGMTAQPVYSQAGTAGASSAGTAEGALASGAPDASGTASIGSDKVVTSPLVGTFYNSPSPEAQAFVTVGDTVKKGQVLGIIEAMKLMNEIESEYDGIVEAILVGNEEVVEYGQPLFRIK